MGTADARKPLGHSLSCRQLGRRPAAGAWWLFFAQLLMPSPPMPRKILVLRGHPDATRRHLCHMQADAYKDDAEQAGTWCARPLHPVGATVVGSVEDVSDTRRQRVREAVEALGRAAR